MDKIEPLEFSDEGLTINGSQKAGELHGELKILMGKQKISLNFKDGILDGAGKIDGAGIMEFFEDKLLKIKLDHGKEVDFTKKNK
jgi:hypothetical protein